MAGYRNRLVHFYHEVSADELYEICTTQLDDAQQIGNTLRAWLANHPQALDETL